MKRPMVVAYRLRHADKFPARAFETVQGAVLLAAEPARRSRLVPEYFNDDSPCGRARPRALAQLTREDHAALVHTFAQIHATLRRDASSRAADAIVDFLGRDNEKMTGQLGLKLMRDGLCAGVDEAGRGPLAGAGRCGRRHPRSEAPHSRRARFQAGRSRRARSACGEDPLSTRSHGPLRGPMSRRSTRTTFSKRRISPCAARCSVCRSGRRTSRSMAIAVRRSPALRLTARSRRSSTATRCAFASAQTQSILAKVTRDRHDDRARSDLSAIWFCRTARATAHCAPGRAEAIGPAPIHRRPASSPCGCAEEAQSQAPAARARSERVSVRALLAGVAFVTARSRPSR